MARSELLQWKADNPDPPGRPGGVRADPGGSCFGEAAGHHDGLRRQQDHGAGVAVREARTGIAALAHPFQLRRQLRPGIASRIKALASGRSKPCNPPGRSRESAPPMPVLCANYGSMRRIADVRHWFNRVRNYLLLFGRHKIQTQGSYEKIPWWMARNDLSPAEIVLFQQRIQVRRHWRSVFIVAKRLTRSSWPIIGCYDPPSRNTP